MYDLESLKAQLQQDPFYGYAEQISANERAIKNSKKNAKNYEKHIIIGPPLPI